MPYHTMLCHCAIIRKYPALLLPAPQVKEAYRRLCKQYHPDLVAPAQQATATLRFKEVIEAYQLLQHGVQVVVGVQMPSLVRMPVWAGLVR
jgi:hypothetical protein